MKLLTTFFAQRRRTPAPLADTQKTYTIRMTVDTASLSTLRQLVVGVCGDALEFMRIAACAGGSRIQVWLCVQMPFAALLSETIVRQLPDAQFRVNPGERGALA